MKVVDALKKRDFLLEEGDLILADGRYEVISKIIEKTVSKKQGRTSFTEVVDSVLLHKYLGIPIFFAMMWALFEFTFVASVPFMDAIDIFFGWLNGVAQSSISNEILASLVGDGIIGGVDFLAVFVPVFAFLYLGLSILEDTGYMARAAFLMDKSLTKVGLQGKSFIPMLMGFGCNMPAIMACRTIENEKDRFVTILVNPLMSCGARLPVYVLFAGIFFEEMAGSVIFSIYLLGIVLAIVMAMIFKNTIFRGEPSPFIMELPPYRVPRVTETVIHVWERVKVYLKKVSGILLVGAIAIWALLNLPYGAEIEFTYAGMIGKAIEPLIKPLGFDWRIGVSLIFGFLAKELVVSGLSVIYAVEEGAGLENIIQSTMTPLTSIAVMVFSLIYVPCLAAVGVIKREMNSWKWALFSIAYLVALAYIVTGIVILIGRLIGYA